MHHTHTINPVLVTRALPDPSPKLRANANSTRPLSALFTHWATCCLLLLALQFSLVTTGVLADDTVGTGSLVLHHSNGDLDALILDASIDVQVQGLLADMTLVQAFRNTTDQWVEGRYLFPLPPDAVVRGLRINVGDRTITGEIQPREEARTAYEVARDAGQIAYNTDTTLHECSNTGCTGCQFKLCATRIRTRSTSRCNADNRTSR